MNPCDEYVVKTLRHLGNDLKGQELEDFRSHLEACADCRAHLKAEKALSETLHRSRPLYSAPAALRDRVSAAVIQQSSPSHLRDPLRPSASRTLTASLRGALERLSSWRILVPATLAIALCLALVPNIVHNVQAASDVGTAVAIHEKSLGGDLPPGLQSNSPEAVTSWFADKVPFYFRLPNAESVPAHKPAYQLTGATLVHYKGNPAALVTYQAPKDKISLLVVSSHSAVVAGGDEVRFAQLTFHYRTESGFRVITWTNHGLSYALVSSVSGPARASCLVCHQNMADRGDLIAQE
jgi:anti-sigma factor RsiW